MLKFIRSLAAFIALLASVYAQAIETIKMSPSPQNLPSPIEHELNWDGNSSMGIPIFVNPVTYEGKEELLGGRCTMIITKYSNLVIEVVLSIADAKDVTVYMEALTLKREAYPSFWGFDYSLSQITTESQLRKSSIQVSRNVGLRFKSQNFASPFGFSIEMTEIIQEQSILGTENLRGRTLYYCPLLSRNS